MHNYLPDIVISGVTISGNGTVPMAETDIDRNNKTEKIIIDMSCFIRYSFRFVNGTRLFFWIDCHKAKS